MLSIGAVSAILVGFVAFELLLVYCAIVFVRRRESVFVARVSIEGNIMSPMHSFIHT
jgi:hypothetical protein